MKKVLLLGGSAQQIIAIETAKRLGYYTVLCDYLPDNPGQHYADRFYLASTTDKERVLEIAREEKIDGIVAYASDPAAPTAAYVAEKMNLYSNSYEAVDILCNKDKFRQFLSENGFNVPCSKGYTNYKDALNDLSIYKLPVIVKPVDSSGSKGVTVLENWDGLEKACEFALSFSREKRFIIEEYIEKSYPYLIGGDIFVSNGKVIMWGLLNCHRDDRVNPLVPVGKSYPLQWNPNVENAVKWTLQELVDKLHISSGAMNVELIIDNKDEVWLIDVGPRNGGNMIPDLLGMIFNVDVVEMTIKTAMGENYGTAEVKGSGFWATHNLHSDRNGVFKGIRFSEEIQNYLVKQIVYKNNGDNVSYFAHAANALGIVFLKFGTMEEENKILSSIYNHIEVLLE